MSRFGTLSYRASQYVKTYSMPLNVAEKLVEIMDGIKKYRKLHKELSEQKKEILKNYSNKYYKTKAKISTY